MTNETTRKWHLFQLLLYSVLANVPDALWDAHESEIEAMRKFMGPSPDKMNMERMQRGAVWEWVKGQAVEIWGSGTSQWYAKDVEPWLKQEKIVW
jgi:hypothetical protein